MIGALLTVLAVSLAQPALPPALPAFVPSPIAPHTVGQPGHLAPEPLPRSPHKRVLPPERGPGIWAGDEPKAKPIVVVTGVPIYPSGQTRIDEVLLVCGADLDRAAVESNLIGKLAAISEDAHLCAVASMMLQCAIMRHERLKARKPIDELALAKHDAAVRFLQYVANLECRDGRERPIRDLLETWSAGLTPAASKGRQ